MVLAVPFKEHASPVSFNNAALRCFVVCLISCSLGTWYIYYSAKQTNPRFGRTFRKAYSADQFYKSKLLINLE